MEGGTDIKEMCLTVMKEMTPDKTQIERLQEAVKAMRDDMQTLKTGIQTHTDTTVQNDLLFHLYTIIKWQASINSDDGWIWFPVTWETIHTKLRTIKKELKKIRVSPDTQAIRGLVAQCATCIKDMETYKTICKGIPGNEDDLQSNEKRGGGILSWMGLRTKLHELKALAS